MFIFSLLATEQTQHGFPEGFLEKFESLQKNQCFKQFNSAQLQCGWLSSSCFYEVESRLLSPEL